MIRPSAMPPKSDATLNIVGSSAFGRNHKISSERTFNMFITDNWLADLAGYKKTLNLSPGGNGNGRALYASSNGNFMIGVVDNIVYRISGPINNLVAQPIFTINTFFGDVTIAENVGYEIGICDGQSVWIYNWRDLTFEEADLPINSQTQQKIIPGYITYADGYFIVPDLTSNFWYLSNLNQGLDWDWGAGDAYVSGRILTKPDFAVAVLRAPGKGNLIYVFGKRVVELWQNVGNQLFPYQRNSSTSIDYGCLSSTTIATMDNYVAFLGSNEKSGPVIMVSQGAGFTHLSTDGIDYKLASLESPETSYGFFYKISGHVFYQLTFYDPRDNYSLVYDFNTGKFFDLTDENYNFSIIESIAFFNNTYYFTSLRDGSIYELSSKYTQYEYTMPGVENARPIMYEIPRDRICTSDRQIDSSLFTGQSLTFTIDQGNDPYFPGSKLFFLTTESGLVLRQEAPDGYIGNFLSTERVVNEYVPRIDMSISKDGGVSYGSFQSKYMHPQGNRKNRIVFWSVGNANDLTFRFRFWSKSHISVSNGVFEARVMEGG